jgi:hypothetical protein
LLRDVLLEKLLNMNPEIVCKRALSEFEPEKSQTASSIDNRLNS